MIQYFSLSIVHFHALAAIDCYHCVRPGFLFGCVVAVLIAGGYRRHEPPSLHQTLLIEQRVEFSSVLLLAKLVWQTATLITTSAHLLNEFRLTLADGWTSPPWNFGLYSLVAMASYLDYLNRDWSRHSTGFVPLALTLVWFDVWVLAIQQGCPLLCALAGLGIVFSQMDSVRFDRLVARLVAERRQK